MAETEKKFGQAFGDLIRKKRGQEDLTQKELAIKAFDDESKVRRIIELENGTVRRPQAKTVDALIVYFGITDDELESCRQHGLFSKKEEIGIGLSRPLMENLALRFEHDNPDADDGELFEYLKSKARELKELKTRLSELEGTAQSLDDKIKAANDALENGQFGDADEILAAAEEIQQTKKTLKEIGAQSKIRIARGDTALFKGDSATAATHYLQASEYVAPFNVEDSARLLNMGAGRIYELERRKPSPDLTQAIALTTRSLERTPSEGHSARWLMRKYHLALLQQSQARGKGSSARPLLDEAIMNAREALNLAGDKIDAFDLTSLRVVLANAYLERAQIPKNETWQADLSTAIQIYENVAKGNSANTLHRCHAYNNISAAYRYKASRCGKTGRNDLTIKAKQALIRTIELAADGGVLDVWAGAQHNLGGMLAEAAGDAEENDAKFLRIQAIAAFQSSLEAFPETAFSAHLARTKLCLGRVFLEQARKCNDPLKEIYLIRAIGEYDAATQIFSKDTNLHDWTEAQYCIGLAFFMHAGITEPQVAIGDLKKAISYFEAARPGYASTGPQKDLKRLLSAQRKARAWLKELQEQGKNGLA